MQKIKTNAQRRGEKGMRIEGGSIMGRMMPVLVSFIFMTFNCYSLECPHCQTDIEVVLAPKHASKDANWRCDGCDQFIWSDTPDMWGDYYCPICGTKK